MKSSNIKLINWKRFFQIFFTTLVPNYIIASYSVPELMDWNKKILDWFNIPYNGLICSILFFALILIIPFLIHNAKWFKDESALSKENEILIKILHGISLIVNNKKKRFFNSKNKNFENSLDYYLDITQPEIQIGGICDTITNLFKSITNEDSIKLTLISCKDNKLDSYLVMPDENSSVNLDDLNNHKSTARHVMKNKKICIIEDVQNLKKSTPFWKSSNLKIKSLIAYPICCGSNTTFVMCISAKKINVFTNKDSDKYQFLLNEFSQRILLESYLLEIKNKSI